MPPNQSSPLEPNQADQFAQQLAHIVHYLLTAAKKHTNQTKLDNKLLQQYQIKSNLLKNWLKPYASFNSVNY